MPPYADTLSPSSTEAPSSSSEQKSSLSNAVNSSSVAQGQNVNASKLGLGKNEQIQVLPNLKLMCLKSGEYITMKKAFKGKNIVLDFWTTRCTRCPDALDKLNDFAASPMVMSRQSNITVVSVCCGDTIDSSREILEASDKNTRWSSIHHYHMSHDEKEYAKTLFGFKQVPFYIIADSEGRILRRGGTIDLKSISSIFLCGDDVDTGLNSAVVGVPQLEERVFELDEDF